MSKYNGIAERLPNWLRWVLIPVMAALTGVLVTLFGGIAAKILVFFDGGRGWGENFFQYLIIPGIASYCSVAVSASVAPRFKKPVAILIASVVMFFAGVLTFMSVISTEWTSLIYVASVCFGSGAGALEYYEEPTQAEVNGDATFAKKWTG